LKIGFNKGTVDSNLYFKIDHENILIVEVFVDDFGGRDSMCKTFANQMKSEFEMSMFGEMNFFLGLQIIKTKKGIFISQTKYVKELLKKFAMEDSKPMSTPMAIGCKLSKGDDSPKADQKKYRSMIGGLLYLTQTRPDIMNVVGLVARFQADPRESHVMAIKKIFRYLKGTVEYGLWYPRDHDFSLHAYTNADWTRDVDDRKSTSGGALFLGKRLVSWLSKKQEVISLSTVEEEYITAVGSCTQVLWMKQMLRDIRAEYEEPITIFCDNSSVIKISKNLVLHSKTKHISIKFHFLREQVNKNEVRLECVPSKDQIADIFTKPLPKDSFE